jgi:hypothetical protein
MASIFLTGRHAGGGSGVVEFDSGAVSNSAYATVSDDEIKMYLDGGFGGGVGRPRCAW